MYATTQPRKEAGTKSKKMGVYAEEREAELDGVSNINVVNAPCGVLRDFCRGFVDGAPTDAMAWPPDVEIKWLCVACPVRVTAIGIVDHALHGRGVSERVVGVLARIGCTIVAPSRTFLVGHQ